MQKQHRLSPTVSMMEVYADSSSSSSMNEIAREQLKLSFHRLDVAYPMYT